MNKALIIFAREPVPGKVKTRLAQDVGEAAATELYVAMLADVLEKAVSFDDVRPMVFWALQTGIIPAGPEFTVLEMLEQRGADLGERMKNAFITAFESGIEACCIIGTDSPDLPREYIGQAFELLERDKADLVFGPADDGGYYLLGLRQYRQELFKGIPWGTPQVLAASLERAQALGLRTSLLPEWYDIDTMKELSRLVDSGGLAAASTIKAAHRLLKDDTTPDPKELTLQPKEIRP